MKYEEKEIKNVETLNLLTQNVAALTIALQTQNEILLVLLHNLDLQIPDWKTMADIEKEVGPKVQKCVELMRSICGPGETNKG